MWEGALGVARWVAACLLGAWLASGWNVRAVGQVTSTQQGAQTSTAGASQEVTGRVLNGKTREPVARALVRLGSRAVLTNHDGVFDFPQVTYSSAALNVSKRGFYPSPDGNDGGTTTMVQIPVTGDVELLLYPEAVVSGTMTNPYGEGVANLQVQMLKNNFDTLGHHWTPSGQTMTLNDGSFRVTLQPGDYRLRTRSFGGQRVGQEFILPVQYPADTSSGGSGLHLDPGQEVHLELRAETRKAYEVTVSTEMPGGRGLPMLTAHTAAGLSFPVMPMGGRGELRFALPSGSYVLSGTVQTQEGAELAQTRLTVADHDVSGVALDFSPLPSFPIELQVEQVATSDNTGATVTPPTAQQLGLIFVPQQDQGDGVRMYGAGSRRGQGPAFELPEGVYRLHSQMQGPWVVTAAICGGTDLMAQDLTVTAGAASAPIRITISNQVGTLSGTVTMDGTAGPAWIYLIATTPTLSPLTEFRAGAAGTFTHRNVPPGSYRVVALERRVAADMTDPAVLATYLDRVQTVMVGAGDQAQVTLAAVPLRDLK